MSRVWHTIDMELTSSSINAAIRHINKCRDELISAMNDLIDKLATQGAQIARMQVVSFDAVDTGELEHSIYGYFDPESRIGYVIAGAAHAFYVEYGTGPRGAASPHPEAGEAAWQYMVGEKIHTASNGVTGWYYTGDDGKAHWTRGQPSRPFMYNTYVWLEEAAESLGKDILK